MLAGAGARKFLDSLSCNTGEATQNAFLDRFGKIVATFEQHRIDDEHFLLLIEQSTYEQLLNHLQKYLKLAQVSLTALEHHVYLALDTHSASAVARDEYAVPYGTGLLIIRKKSLPTNVSEEEYTLFRITNKIPLQGLDYDTEMILNIFPEGYVSYTKGCYLGQEVIAKVHNLAEPPNKLVVKYEDECTANEKKKMTSKVKEPQTGRIKGFVVVPKD